MKFENKVLPNEQQLKGFDDNPEIGPIKMLNLVKLKKHAEYSDGRETNLSGLEAVSYTHLTLPTMYTV